MRILRRCGDLCQGLPIDTRVSVALQLLGVEGGRSRDECDQGQELEHFFIIICELAASF